MIKQTWIINRELFEITIKGKKVFYRDRKVGANAIQMIPKDPRVIKMILTSRNRIDSNLIKQFELTNEEQEEYNTAIKSNKDIERRLADICKKDCLKTGAVLEEEIN